MVTSNQSVSFFTLASQTNEYFQTNVLVNGHFVAKLYDFGVSTLTDASSETQQDVNIGTFQYLAPEAFKQVLSTMESDIWAFGCICLEVGFYLNSYYCT